ncbi:MAG: glycosyltransferase family 2 protein [Thermoleophilia bacterium]
MTEGNSAAVTQTTVVIPNWNGLRHLEECLLSLRDQTYPSFKTIMVDNASSDASVEYVSSQFPEVEIVVMPRNGGFSYAVNEGIRRADTPYVVLLNNDTRVDRDWLRELTATLNARLDYDMAASLMLFYDYPDVVNAAGDVFDIWAAAGLNRGIYEPMVKYLEPCRVLGACAGAAIYRRSLFEDIGLFDEDFFLMSEDTDLNLRALIAGKKCAYVPTARVWHKFQGSISTQPSAEMSSLGVRNLGRVFAKDIPLPLLLLPLPLWGYRMFRRTIPLRPSKWHRVPELASKMAPRPREMAGGFFASLPKREQVWKLRKIPRTEVIRWVMKGSGPLD